MNFHKFALASLIFQAITPIISYSLPQQSIIGDRYKDFGKDKEGAEKWGKEKYQDWTKNIISDAEKDSLKKYTLSAREMNGYLRKNAGNLISEQGNLSDEKWKRYNELNETIEHIDSALGKIKTPENLHVYRRANEHEFQIPVGTLRDRNKNIHQEVFKKIVNDYQNKHFISHAYMSTSLNKIHTPFFNSQHQSILMKIKLPKSIHAAYLETSIGLHDENEMLINRGYTFKYEKFSIIKDGTNEITKINVSLIPPSKLK